MSADVFTDKEHRDVVYLVVRRADGTLLIYGENEEPMVILPPQEPNGADKSSTRDDAENQ